MKVRFHPEFPKDVRNFAGDYREISPALEERFRIEVNEAIATVKVSPTGAGHYLLTGSAIITDVRRRNLRSFPFFILYGLSGELLIFGSLIPSRSDPLTWLSRLGPAVPNSKA
jgi:hypothetical protein